MPTFFDADAIVAAMPSPPGVEKAAMADMGRRFKRFVEYFNNHGAISDADFPAALAQMSGLLRKRVQLEKDWIDSPEILEQEIRQPFFVVGHARSGTTILQCLLGLNQGHRMPRYWEVRHPSPAPGLDPAQDALSVADEDRHVADLLQIAPTLLAAHPYLEQGGLSEAECEDLMTLDFHMLHVLPLTRVPSLPYPIVPEDSVAALRFHRKLLQQFQWQTPTGRWVCKGTTHQYNLPALWEVYPDAICFWAHRAPEDYMASFFEMIDILYRPINGALFRETDVRAVVEQLKLATDHVLASDWIDDPRVCHIRFRDLVDNPVATIKGSYERCSIDFTPEYEASIRAFFSDPARRSDRHGKFHYSLQKFGLLPEEIRNLFKDYCDRFEL